MTGASRLPASFSARLRGAPVTWALTAINVAVFVIAESHGRTTRADVLLRFGAVEPQHVWAGEYWRLATYMFLHVGLVHLIWNAYASIGWCSSVERDLGSSRFLGVYLLSGVAGGAATTVLEYPVSAGASGAMFGIVGATLALRARQLPSVSAAWRDGPTRATLVSIALWTVIGVVALPMNNRAHLGGLVAGAALTWALTARRRTPLLAVFGVGWLALLALGTRPWLLLGRGAAPPSEGVALEEEGARLQAQCEAGNNAACHAFTITMPSFVGDTTRHLELACDTGDADACGAWGWTLAHGRPGVKRDEARGAALMKQACERGSAWSCQLANGAPPGRVP